MSCTTTRGTSSSRPAGRPPRPARAPRRPAAPRPSTSSRPAGSSIIRRRAGWRYWRRQSTRSSSSTARTTTAPGCSSTTRVKGSSSGWPGRRTTSARSAKGSDVAVEVGAGIDRPALLDVLRPGCSCAGGYRSGMTDPGATPASLTQQEARDRAALIEVDRYDIRVDMRGLARGRPVAGHLVGRVHLPRAGRLDVRRLRGRGAVRDAERRRAGPLDRGRRPDPAARAGCRERPGRLLRADRHRVGRRDPAQRRPPGQAGLRLVDLRAGRRQACVGLLRPARPQGRARLPGERTAGVDGAQQHRPGGGARP